LLRPQLPRVYTIDGAMVTLPGRTFILYRYKITLDVPLLRVDIVHRVVVWQRNKQKAEARQPYNPEPLNPRP
jgi:hypothetical protein